MNTHIIPAFGQLLLCEVTQARVRQFIIDLRAGGLAKKTVSNIRGVLHACLAAAVDAQLLPLNPASFRSRSRLLNLTTTPGEARAKIKAMDVDQARAFFARAPVIEPRRWLLFRAMFSCGLRPGEAMGLQPGDIDYRGLRIRLERAISQKGGVEPCKTNARGEWDYVDLAPGLAEDLRAWERQLAEEALAAGRTRSTWLFPSKDGGPDVHIRVYEAMERICKAAGIPRFSPHCLRHTYASQQLAAGESVYYVSRQLRHADIRITARVYGSWLPAGDQKAAARLEERIFGASVLSAAASKGG